jgi:ketosteroid isomerase-like protein
MTISDHDAAAIRQATANFCKAVSTDDLEAMVAIATDDCLVFPPNEAGHSGKVGSRKWHEARMAQFTTNLEMSSQELLETGELAFHRVSFRIQLTPKSGGTPITDTGMCVWLWRREADTWRIVRAIWNSDTPIPAAV